MEDNNVYNNPTTELFGASNTRFRKGLKVKKTVSAFPCAGEENLKTAGPKGPCRGLPKNSGLQPWSALGEVCGIFVVDPS